MVSACLPQQTLTFLTKFALGYISGVLNQEGRTNTLRSAVTTSLVLSKINTGFVAQPPVQHFSKTFKAFLGKTL